MAGTLPIDGTLEETLKGLTASSARRVASLGSLTGSVELVLLGKREAAGAALLLLVLLDDALARLEDYSVEVLALLLEELELDYFDVVARLLELLKLLCALGFELGGEDALLLAGFEEARAVEEEVVLEEGVTLELRWRERRTSRAFPCRFQNEVLGPTY